MTPPPPSLPCRSCASSCLRAALSGSAARRRASCGHQQQQQMHAVNGCGRAVAGVSARRHARLRPVPRNTAPPRTCGSAASVAPSRRRLAMSRLCATLARLAAQPACRAAAAAPSLCNGGTGAPQRSSTAAHSLHAAQQQRRRVDAAGHVQLAARCRRATQCTSATHAPTAAAAAAAVRHWHRQRVRSLPAVGRRRLKRSRQPAQHVLRHARASMAAAVARQRNVLRGQHGKCVCRGGGMQGAPGSKRRCCSVHSRAGSRRAAAGTRLRLRQQR